jgi:CrcB protein
MAGETEPDDETATGGQASHPLKRLEPLLLIAVGGFVGAMLRHLVAVSLPAGALPWGTLAANVSGSFALGVLLYEKHLADLLTPQARLIVGTGFLSSFTTYSTFAVDTASLSPEFAVLNVAGNYALGFAAVGLGQIVARWLA